MTQQLQIALDPALGLHGKALVSAWNEAETTRSVGVAVLDPSPSATFFAGDVIVALLTVANSIAASVLANLLTDLLKEKFGVQKTETAVVEQPDGKTVIIIKKL